MSRVFVPTFFCFALLLAIGGSLRPIPGGTSTVLLPPWVNADSGLRTVIAAGGQVLSVAFEGRVIRAVFENGVTGRLLATGILLVLRADSRPCSSGDRA